LSGSESKVTGGVSGRRLCFRVCLRDFFFLCLLARRLRSSSLELETVEKPEEDEDDEDDSSELDASVWCLATLA
jgi:hypothetical protein